MPPPNATAACDSATPAASAYRVLDANANRAMEGLRVVEDYLRFHCQDPFLSGTCKQLRHDTASNIGGIGEEFRLSCRDTLGDVGTAARTTTEYDRPSLDNLVHANLGRVTEAMRTLEEFSKLVSVPIAERFEQLRYRVYTLQKAMGHSRRANDRLANAQLYVLADLTSAGLPSFQRRMEGLLPNRDVDVLQLRDKERTDREMIEAARWLRGFTRRHDTLFIVNDRPDIARLVQADGVHVGQDEMDVADVRSVVGPSLLIGVSTHTLEQARRAVLQGADYVGVGPVFASPTKRFDQLAGLALVEAVNGEIGLPAFAIGGIQPSNVDLLLAAGATRIAVGSAVWSADDPSEAARELKRFFVEDGKNRSTQL